MQATNKPDIQTDNNNQTGFNLELNNLDRVAYLTMTLAAGLGFKATDLTEESLLLKNKQELTSQESDEYLYKISKFYAEANWALLITGLILFYTSSERLEEDKANDPQISSEINRKRISGREKVTLGNLFKTIGFGLAANGFEEIAASSQVQE